MDTSLPVFAKYLLEGTIFKSGVDVAVFKTMLNAKREADATRRRAMRERVDLFEDDAGRLVKRKIQQQFEFENVVEVFKTLDLSNNLCKKIITNVSTIYDEPPKWELAKDDGGAWADLRKNANLDLVMPEVNQFTNLCNEAIVRAAVHKGKIDYQIFTPDQVMIEQHPKHSTRMSAIWVWVPLADTTNDGGYWHYWDANHDKPAHHIFDEAFNIVDKKFDVDGVNPYVDENGDPVIPFVIYHRKLPRVDIWDRSSGGDIVDGTAMLMAMESLMNHLYRVDSAAIKYVIGGPDEEAMSGQVAGALRLLVLRSMQGENITAGQFRSQADWKGLRQVVSDKAQNLLNNYGLSLAAVELTGNPSSGFALKVRREPLLEIRKRQIPLYRMYDRELYAVSAAVWNYERTRADEHWQDGMPADGKPMLWPSEADPKITYADYQTPLTVAEEQSHLEAMQVRLSMGMTSIVKEYMREHPEMTPEEAEAEIDANIKLNQKYAAGTELVMGRAQVLPVSGAPAKGQVVPGAAGMKSPGLSTSPMGGAGGQSQPAKPTKP